MTSPSDAVSDGIATLELDYCGQVTAIPPDRPFYIGRDADLVVDDNPYLHRRFVCLSQSGGIWWLLNSGSQLSATVSDGAGRMQAWLSPGARLPIVFERTLVRFTAGPTTYEFDLLLDEAPFSADVLALPESGSTTIGRTTLTRDQKRLVVALAEPMLRQLGKTPSAIPSNADAAARLGWTATKFNRKLDNVCQKLTQLGVRGLHGGPERLASNRRARLVEYALAVSLVSPGDLPMLESLPRDVAGADE